MKPFAKKSTPDHERIRKKPDAEKQKSMMEYYDLDKGQRMALAAKTSDGEYASCIKLLTNMRNAS